MGSAISSNFLDEFCKKYNFVIIKINKIFSSFSQRICYCYCYNLRYFKREETHSKIFLFELVRWCDKNMNNMWTTSAVVACAGLVGATTMIYENRRPILFLPFQPINLLCQARKVHLLWRLEISYRQIASIVTISLLSPVFDQMTQIVCWISSWTRQVCVKKSLAFGQR